MYIANIRNLKYDVYAIGRTESELKENTIKALEQYLMAYRTTIEDFIENECDESLANYDNSVWNFLREYLGVSVHNIDKGYALGWE